ncbi:MAG: hypothetical protein H6R03_880 [Burkholderiaceae bacterium]|nr:hypothetical protein [Burkholderiaceae bacterium]
MFGKKSNGDKHIASLIGAGSTLVGDLAFAGGLRIDGTVQGSVHCVGGEGSGMLVISEKGVVEGEVRAAHLVVAGRIAGPVYTTEVVELQPTARVAGDIRYRALESAAQDGMKGNLKLAVGATGTAKTQSAGG